MSLLPRRLRALWSADSQTAVDADQTLSDADQTSADTDQSLSDRDQAAARSDQQVSDREQAVADREFDAAPQGEGSDALIEHEKAHAERDESTMSRSATAAVRTLISGERDAQAERRDQIARERDHRAGERDQVSEVADHQAESLAGVVGEIDAPTKAALDAAASARSLAAAARVKAAGDRERAARDREAAAKDRDFLRGEMERSQLDELTGAYRRGLGEILLRHEVERAGRSGGPLTVAFLDADDLKKTNADSGHAAGDSLLRSTFTGLQARLRPYDPIIRWGGDEFVCSISGISFADTQARIQRVQTDLSRRDPRVSVTYGLAEMEPGDTMAELLARADAAQREAKRRKHA